MKIAFMCDMHLPLRKDCVQYEYFKEAVEDIKKSDSDITIVVGDIAAYGEENALSFFKNAMKELPHTTVLGNSDVRDGDIDRASFGGNISVGSRNILCINTPYAQINKEDKEKIVLLEDGDILVMHHSIPALREESRNFLTEVLEQKALTVIHAHSHNFQDYRLGKSRVVCIRALDGDKSIGAPPCITYFEITENSLSFSEKLFTVDPSLVYDFRDYLGISCFDVKKDIDFAIENNLHNLELRKYNENDGLFDFTVNKIQKWKKVCGKNLSVHMPNIRFSDEKITANGWEYAKKLALSCDANILTIHVPRISVFDMENNFNVIAKFYADKISEFPEKVKVGIENLHMENNELPDKSRGFGYTPIEVISFVDTVNDLLGEKRVGVTLDIGHARNNPPYNSIYPLGMWYSLLGDKTVAYHMHQVSRENGVLKNHTEIKSLFGPMISFSSFFKAWSIGQLNKCPVFLEIRDINERHNSVSVFDNLKKDGFYV